jgi:hypothetical protein
VNDAVTAFVDSIPVVSSTADCDEAESLPVDEEDPRRLMEVTWSEVDGTEMLDTLNSAFEVVEVQDETAFAVIASEAEDEDMTET